MLKVGLGREQPAKAWSLQGIGCRKAGLLERINEQRRWPRLGFAEDAVGKVGLCWGREGDLEQDGVMQKGGFTGDWAQNIGFGDNVEAKAKDWMIISG